MITLSVTASVRKRYEREAEHLTCMDRFKNPKVADFEGDRGRYRSILMGNGLYFEGAMGAEAIKKRLEPSTWRPSLRL